MIIQENAFDNVVWKIAAILSQSQGVNDFFRIHAVVGVTCAYIPQVHDSYLHNLAPQYYPYPSGLFHWHWHREFQWSNPKENG